MKAIGGVIDGIACAGLGRLVALASLIVAAFGAIAPAWAQEKIALVIGNGDYATSRWDLRSPVGGHTPVNDARLMAETLGELGFADVVVVENASRERMIEAVEAFGRALRNAGPDAVGFFYFTGHAQRIDGENYLFPVDLKADYREQVRTRAFNAAEVFLAIGSAPEAAASFVVLDACQDAGLPAQQALYNAEPGGLAAPAPPQTLGRWPRVLIGFATQPGEFASAGSGKHSPYTKALSDALRANAAASATDIFESVTSAVATATAGGDRPQRPYYVSHLGRVYRFKEGERAAPSTPAVDGAEIAWSYLKDSTDAAALERFAAENKDHPRAGEALRRAASLATASRPSSSPPSATTSAPPPVVAAPAPSATASGRRAGEEFRDCSDCPVMVVVPGGSFTMGSEDGGSDEKPTRPVTIPRAFAVGKFEVTWAEWEACVSGGGCSNSGPDGAGGDEGWGKGSRPVINVSWDDAQAYARWLSGKTGQDYRLLSEAEWEYAARAGSQARWSFGDDEARLGAHAWYSSNAGGKTQAVGGKAANAFGLHDMHGNVWEWVEDCYRNSYETAPTDGSAVRGGLPGADECSLRVLRGGSWGNIPLSLRSAVRYRSSPSLRFSGLGFRLARTVSP